MTLKAFFKICLLALLTVARKDDVKKETIEKNELEFVFNVEQFADVINFYKAKTEPNPGRLLSYGLN